MKELLLIIISSALVNNVVLSQFLGLCPFLGVSKKVETAAGMGGAVIFVITLSSFCTGENPQDDMERANEASAANRFIFVRIILVCVITRHKVI